VEIAEMLLMKIRMFV